VAKKKHYGSINLLKGIRGSKLATLIAVIAIVLAIPLTVIMSRQQQQTQQEASIGVGGSAILGAYCASRGGKCVDTKKFDTRRGIIKTGLCPGILKCFIPSGPMSCKVYYPKGQCQFKNLTSCSGVYKSNLCQGYNDPYFACCTKK